MTTIDYYLEYLLSENWFFVRFCVTQLSNRNLLRSDVFKIGTKSFKLFVISSINVKQKRNQRIPKVPILTAICNFVSQRDKHTIFFMKSYQNLVSYSYFFRVINLNKEEKSLLFFPWNQLILPILKYNRFCHLHFFRESVKKFNFLIPFLLWN